MDDMNTLSTRILLVAQELSESRSWAVEESKKEGAKG
jgi:hypothetical protein